MRSIVPMDDLWDEEVKQNVKLKEQLVAQANKHLKELEELQLAHRQEKDWMMRYICRTSDAMKYVKPGTYGRPG